MAPTTAQQIAVAARRLFEAHGPAAVSMRRVAGVVGITPMAIYRHYAGSDALIEEVARQGFDELARHLRATRGKTPPVRYVAKVMDAYVAYGLERPRMFDLMFLDRRSGARRFPDDFRAGLSPTGNLLAQAIDEAMCDGSLRKDDVWEVMMTVWSHVHGLVVLYRAGRFNLGAAKFRALCRRSFSRVLHGLAS